MSESDPAGCGLKPNNDIAQLLEVNLGGANELVMNLSSQESKVFDSVLETFRRGDHAEVRS